MPLGRRLLGLRISGLLGNESNINLSIIAPDQIVNVYMPA